MKKRVICLTAAVSMLAISLSGCGKKPPETSAEVSTGTNVSVYTAKNSGIQNTVTYTGEIKPSDSASVSAKVSGTAKTVNVELGKYVRAGDVLLTIDSTDYQLQYNQALASYNSAKASYNSTVGGQQQQNVNNLRDAITNAENEYNNALSNYNREKTLYDNNTNLISAKNAYEDAKNNYERTKSLYALGAVSETALDSARIACENAEAAVTSTENNLKSGIESAKSRLDSAEVNLASAKQTYELTVNVTNPETEATAKAQVESAKAALDLAKNNLNNTTITAPISGYISSKSISKGEIVSQGRELFSISSTDTVEGEISVTESIIPYIQIGTPASISVKSAGVEQISGSVSLVNTVKSDTTGLYTVRVSIPNSDHALKSGMFADITLVTEVDDNALTVPATSLIQEGEDFYVYVVDEDSMTAEKRIVTTGITNGESMEIKSGLSSGEVVVVSGKEYLSEKNNAVNITSREEDANDEAA